MSIRSVSARTWAIHNDMDRIESDKNSKIKNIKALMTKSRLRKDTGFFIAEGPRMVFETPEELLLEVYVTESFLRDDRWQSFYKGLKKIPDIYEVTDAVMKSASDTVTPQGVMAVVREPEYDIDDLLKPGAMLLLLERLQDPGNMGTIFRTAEGAGATGIIMSGDCVDIFSPKVVRSTMGSLYRVPFYITSDIIDTARDIKGSGIRLYATEPKVRRPYYEGDYIEDCGFMIGNEGAGLSRELSSLADERIAIPMHGQVESLNAAMATGILLYEALRQRMG